MCVTPRDQFRLQQELVHWIPWRSLHVIFQRVFRHLTSVSFSPYFPLLFLTISFRYHSSVWFFSTIIQYYSQGHFSQTVFSILLNTFSTTNFRTFFRTFSGHFSASFSIHLAQPIFRIFFSILFNIFCTTIFQGIFQHHFSVLFSCTVFSVIYPRRCFPLCSPSTWSATPCSSSPVNFCRSHQLCPCLPLRRSHYARPQSCYDLMLLAPGCTSARGSVKMSQTQMPDTVSWILS